VARTTVYNHKRTCGFFNLIILKMPKDKKQEAGISINIRSAANGFTVSGYPASSRSVGRGEDNIEYVYKTLDQVIKELPAIYSVLQSSESKPKNEKDLKELRDQANEEAGKGNYADN